MCLVGLEGLVNGYLDLLIPGFDMGTGQFAHVFR